MPETTMLEDLSRIETSAIERLCEIKHEQQVLDQRLEMMKEKEGSVSEAVYKRVQSDYFDRHQALEDKARPLKEQARQQYARLRGLREQIEGTLEAARLDKEELEFRHGLGEFEEEEFKERLSACETQLTAREAELEEAENLKARFLEAFHSEDELLAEPAEVPEESPPEVSEVPEQPPPPPEPAAIAQLAEDETVTGMTAVEEQALDEMQVVGKRLDSSRVQIGVEVPPPPATDKGRTVVMRKPRLIGKAKDGTPEEYFLGLEPVLIGRSATSTIRITGPAISRQHADLIFGPRGYTIRDLGSENGTRVNGELITEKILANGDVIAIGTQELVFRDE